MVPHMRRPIELFLDRVAQESARWRVCKTDRIIDSTYHGSVESLRPRWLDEFTIVCAQEGFVRSRYDTWLWREFAFLSCWIDTSGLVLLKSIKKRSKRVRRHIAQSYIYKHTHDTHSINSKRGLVQISHFEYLHIASIHVVQHIFPRIRLHGHKVLVRVEKG